MASPGADILWTAAWPFQKLPLGFHYFWGRVFAFIARDILHYRRDVIVQNLSRAFPEKGYKEIRRLADRAYDHMGQIFAEAMWFGGCRGDVSRLMKQDICRYESVSELMDAYQSRPGVVVLNSHLGNWELTGGCVEYAYDCPSEKYPRGTVDPDTVCVVYKKMKSKAIDGFMAKNRCSAIPAFKGYVETYDVLRYAISRKGEKNLYVFPTDQFPYKGTSRCEIPSFMGQPTKSMTGAAAIARKFGYAVFYLAIARKSRGKYSARFVKITDDASGTSPEAIMTKFYSLLEEDIKADPANYLWSHKRWK